MFLNLLAAVFAVSLLVAFAGDRVPRWVPMALWGVLLLAATAGGFAWGWENLGPWLDPRI